MAREDRFQRTSGIPDCQASPTPPYWRPFLRTVLALGGSVLVIGGLFLSIARHSTFWYSAFVVGGFLLLEAVNGSKGFSVLKHTEHFLKVWLIFFGLAIAIEVLGRLWLNLWSYPRLHGLQYVFHVLIVGYPFVGFFSLEFLVWLQSFSWVRRTQPKSLPVALFAFAYLNEIPNTFVCEWSYSNWPLGELLKIPVLVPFLWISLLFVVLYKPWFTDR
jgi:hypothetical protein